MEKKILLITYHFPPSLAVGGNRIKGFVKYLPIYGWKPLVLTIDEKFLDNRDDSSMSVFKDIKIIRARQLPTLRDAYLLLKNGLQKFQKDKASQNCVIQEDNSSAEGLVRKFRRYFISLLITLPDIERSWVIPALISALKEIKHENIDVVFTTGPPHSVHLVGLLLKLFARISWIADFRDPWMTPFNKWNHSTCGLSNVIERWMERKVFRNADLVLATTVKLTQKLKKEYSALPPAKIKFLSNGFDKENFSCLNSLKKYEIFTIIYTGSIYFGRSPEPLFRAIKELIVENRLKSSDIRIKLIGNCRFIEGQSTAELVSSYELDTVVEISDYLSYSKAIEIVKRSHLALLLANNQPYQIPAKVYDYMGAETSIIALTKHGATADLLKSIGVGMVIEPCDIQSIKNFICDSISKKKILCSYGRDECNLYNSKKIVKDLAQELNRLATDR